MPPSALPIVAPASLSPRPLILGIGGCSGSGKTTLARELATQLDGTLFPLDLYYRDLSYLPVAERDRSNFDHPDSLECELFTAHIRSLAAGHAVDRPIYDFSTHTRVLDRFDRITPSHVVVVEGILALHFPELQPLFHFAVYVDAPDEICLRRRIFRDMRERGRTEASVRAQFDATTRPMAELFVVPSQRNATLTVAGTEALDWSIEQVLCGLRLRGLLR